MGERSPSRPVPDSRDAIQLASEILSFYGPRTLAGDHGPAANRCLSRPVRRRAGAWITGLSCSRTLAERLLLRLGELRDPAALPAGGTAPGGVGAAGEAGCPACSSRWQGFGDPPAEDNLADKPDYGLRGYSAPLKVWLDDLLAARFGPLPPGAMEAALQRAELSWIGTGRETMTVAYPEDQILLRVEAGPDQAPENIRAGFADPSARYGFAQIADAQEAPLDEFAETFWSAVWQGWLTADTLRPLRQGIERGFGLKPVAADRSSLRRARRGAFRGEPRGFVGNWQLIEPVPGDSDPLTALEDDKERARFLLDRYGLVTRELANREGGNLRWPGCSKHWP